MSTVAVVPARSGSKRITDKNVRPLGGRPLVFWTLEACLTASTIDQVILSTDSMHYWKLAEQAFGSTKLRLDFRTAEEAADEVKIFDYLKDAAKKLFTSDEEVFVLALPTVPFRSRHHIDEAVSLFKKTGRPVFSATEYSFPISFAFHTEDQFEWSPTFANSPMVTGNTRSQSQVKKLRPNGAVYVRLITDLIEDRINTLYENALCMEMNLYDSVDIDHELDFIFAEAVLSSSGKPTT